MIVREEILRVAEAARITGFSTQHMRLLIRQGELAGIKIGRDWIISKESLSSFLARRNTKPMLRKTKAGRRPKVPSGSAVASYGASLGQERK